MRNSMKIMFVIAALSVCVTTTAQTRRPAAKKPAATAKKPAAAKLSGKFAILQLDEWVNCDLFEDVNYIYFLDYPNGESNALRAVDKKTGEVKLIVPRKTRRRAKILCAGADSTNLYFRLEDKGIVKFNGTDVNTSEVLLAQGEWGKTFLPRSLQGEKIITSPNGRYLALIGSTPNLVFDQKEKRVVGYYDKAQDGLLSDKGTLIYINIDEIGVLPKGAPTQNTRDKLNSLGHKLWKMKEIGNGGGGELSGIWRDDVDSMIYVGMGEQVMRSPMKKMKWEEAFVLPGENKKFTRIAFSQNHVLGETDNFEKHYYEWNNKKLEGTPTITKMMWDTDIIDKSGWDGNTIPERISSPTRLYCDWMGNFWFQQGDGRFYIYNPDGIKGLTALKNKITKNNLPPVD